MTTLQNTLLNGVPHGIVKRIMVGINWTMVEGKHGCGLAQTPQRNSPGCQAITAAGQLASMDLRCLANLIKNPNPMEVAIGMAAINASYNRYDLDAKCDDNGLDAFGTVDQSVAVVGRFPGLERRYSLLKVIEKDPRKGEYPETKAKAILESSHYAIITASTFVNGTAEKMVSYADKCETAIIGPGTPLCPKLFELGVSVLSGLIIDKPSDAFQIIAEGGAVKELKNASHYATIRKG